MHSSLSKLSSRTSGMHLFVIEILFLELGLLVVIFTLRLSASVPCTLLFFQLVLERKRVEKDDTGFSSQPVVISLLEDLLSEFKEIHKHLSTHLISFLAVLLDPLGNFGGEL